MKIAIVSDIHGNLEALDAVRQDLATQSVDEVYCLGDSIGYGPNPRECLDWSSEQALYLLGNAEESALFGPEVGGEAASAAMRWTRAVLNEGAGADERRRVLDVLPRVMRREDILWVHASPRSPLHEYLYPQVAQPRERFEGLLRLIPRLAFVGHTHLPGVMAEDGLFVPATPSMRWRLGAGKFIVNVGSVGQSRDGDLRACYVVWDGDEVEFRRVSYEVAVTIGKIQAIPELTQSKALSWLGASAAT